MRSIKAVLPWAILLWLPIAAAPAEAEEFPENALGPVVMIQGIFGAGYERCLSEHLAFSGQLCTSSRIDFCGVRLLLSRNDTAVLIRPFLGFCFARGSAEDDPTGHRSPWSGYAWPGVGICWRSGRISTSLDGSAAYGSNSTGSLDDGFLSVTASVMYMF